MAKLARQCVSFIVFGVFLLPGLPPLAAQTANGLEKVLASRSPDSWTEITVDSTRDVGTFLSVAIEPQSGAPFLSYYEGEAGDLWFAHYVGTGGNCGPSSSWHCQLVTSTGNVGRYNAIAVHRSLAGEVSVIISFFDATQFDLRVARAVCTDACPFAISTIHSGSINAPKGLHTAVAYCPHRRSLDLLPGRIRPGRRNRAGSVKRRGRRQLRHRRGGREVAMRHRTEQRRDRRVHRARLRRRWAPPHCVLRYVDRLPVLRGAYRIGRQLRAGQCLDLSQLLRQHPRQRPVDRGVRRARRHAASRVRRRHHGRADLRHLCRDRRQLRLLGRFPGVGVAVRRDRR